MVQTLRSQNPSVDIFWTGDPLPSGLGWFQFIEQNIQQCSGFVGVITNNSSGTNNWINFEAGAAVGRNIGRMFIYAPGIAIPADLSGPLKNIQLVGWTDRAAIKEGLGRLQLNSSEEAAEVTLRVFTPFQIDNITYGIAGAMHQFSPQERQAFFYQLENRKQIVIGNLLIGNHDPAPGIHKQIQLDISRNQQRYSLTFEEESLVRRSDLYQ